MKKISIICFKIIFILSIAILFNKVAFAEENNSSNSTLYLDDDYNYFDVVDCRDSDKKVVDGYAICAAKKNQPIEINVTCSQSEKYYIPSITIDGEEYKAMGCRYSKKVYSPIVDNNQNTIYNNFCGQENVRKAMRIIGYVVLVVRWVVPFLIVIFGMIDFAKASMSNDDKALNKSLEAFIRRLIAGVLTFLAPTILLAIINVLGFSGGIEKNDFRACTICILNVKECGNADNKTSTDIPQDDRSAANENYK